MDGIPAASGEKLRKSTSRTFRRAHGPEPDRAGRGVRYALGARTGRLCSHARRQPPLSRHLARFRDAGEGPRRADDAGGEGAQQVHDRAGDPAARGARLQLVERGAARRGARGHRHRVPAGDRHGGDLGHRPDARGRDVSPTSPAPNISTRSSPTAPQRLLPGAHLLVAQHQHLPRSALGTRAGNLWRGSVPHRPRSDALHRAACRATIRNICKTIATSKHFAVHSGPEQSRHKRVCRPSAQDLEETYLPAFRTTVTDANVESVMCAYNARRRHSRLRQRLR